VAILLRRYLAPQRDTLARLGGEHADLFDESRRLVLRECSDGLARMVEELDAARDRAAVLHEELSARLAETMNKNMYLLSIVAAIFLPLGLLTGLFGINVGGMPWLESRWGFAIVSSGLVGVAIFQYWLFRRLQLL
jgi:zinc transporter